MSADQYYWAHISGNRKEPLNEHLQKTAEKAQDFIKGKKFEKWAYIAGLLHDLGKYSQEFQKRILGKNILVDHSTAGAREICKIEKKLGKILAYIIAGHHTGLPNGSTGNKSDLTSLENRLDEDKKIPICNYPDSLIKELENKLPLSPKDDLPFPLNRKDLGFGISIFIRFLFSCVTDADFLETEKFCDPEKANLRQDSQNKYLSLEELQNRLSEKLEKFKEKLEELKKNKDEKDISKIRIFQIRCDVLQQCLNAAEQPPGLFSLTVPTGGAKTLSSIAFALRHAIKYGKKRIIYVIPYTSIIEQTADIFREIFGNNNVLEHHSNYDFKKFQSKNEEDDDKEDEMRYFLSAENWDAPIIVTTNVQFFESLFACKSSRCRKLHNIIDSIVIFDEAQMLPNNLLYPCIAIIQELTNYYGVSAVLCTATQPSLDKRDNFPGLENVREIIQNTKQLYESLHRVEVKQLKTDANNEKISDEDLIRHLKAHKQVLCVVNTRNHARHLFEMLGDMPGKYHLSALMCPAHRSKKLQEIKKYLKNAIEKNILCIVISTQLIEAGVDIDFPVVYRSIAGIDSIAQSAGRCNREGQLKDDQGNSIKGKVFVFEPDSDKKILRNTGANQARSILRRFSDILSLDAIKDYFQQFFWSKGNLLDEKNILDKDRYDKFKMDIDFRGIAQDFQLIQDDIYESIIIPWEEGIKYCEELKTHGYTNPFVSQKLLRQLQRYTINIPQQEYKKLLLQKVIDLHQEKYAILNNQDIYSDDFGLSTDDPTYRKSDSLIL